MVDNLQQLLGFLKFHDGTSYHVQVMTRSKDGHNRSSTIIGEWYISSADKMQLLAPGWKQLCELYNARCYIGINAKNTSDVLWNLCTKSLDRLKTNSFGNLNAFLSSAHDTAPSALEKYWIIDWDDINPDLLLEVMKFLSTNLKLVVKTINGYHLIVIPFDSREFRTEYPEATIHKNNMTLLFSV